MTFCLGIRVREGLVAIADTRITTGNEMITGRKVTIHHQPGGSLFLMTSGLRSVRDKVVTYFDDELRMLAEPLDRTFKCVNLYAEQLRRVHREDGDALRDANLSFNLHTLIGGQMSGDRDHRLFMIYPQGNWVDVGPGTPYQILGATGYGTRVLDRTLKFEDSMRTALKVGCLALDSTRISAADVDFPIDVVLYEAATRRIAGHRYTQADLLPISEWWQERLRTSVAELPSQWIDHAFGQLDRTDDDFPA